MMPTRETIRFRARVRESHFDMLDLARRLAREGGGRPAEDVALVHNHMAFALRGFYLVMTDTDRTAVQRLAFGRASAKGPAGVETPAAFYVALRAGQSPVPAPTAPIVLCDPATAVRIPLGRVVRASAALGLDAGRLPDSSIVAAEWIETLAVS